MNYSKTLIFLFLTSIILEGCDQKVENETYYESGNLRSVSTQMSDTIHQTHYYDSTEVLIKTKMWLQDELVLKIQHYTYDGIKFYESTLAQKNLFIKKDSSTIFISANPKKFDYLSFSLDSSCFQPDFWDYFPRLSHNVQLAFDSSQNKYVTGASFDYKTEAKTNSSMITSLTDTIVGGVIFEYNTEVLEDSTAIITSEHDYFKYSF